MTIAVCFNCGATKFGALTPCFKCKVMPREVDDLAMSLALSDHYMSVDKLKEVGGRIRNGGKAVLSEQQMLAFREAAQGFQHMLPTAVERRRTPPQLTVKPRRSALRRVATAYIQIGCLFGATMWASYLYPVTMLPNLSLWEQASAIPTLLPIATLSGGVRVATWGPSLVLWFLTPNDYSFGKWLAPGFYAERLDPDDPFFKKGTTGRAS